MSGSDDDDREEGQVSTESDENAFNPESEVDLASLRADVGTSRHRVSQVVMPGLHKPQRNAFCRVHPEHEMVLTAFLVGMDLWFISAELAAQINASVDEYRLVLAVTRQQEYFLWPIRIPRGRSASNPWNVTHLEAAEQSKTFWTRMSSNQGQKKYDVHVAEYTDDPVWPAEKFETLVKKALRGRVVDSLDHPIARQLSGRR